MHVDYKTDISFAVVQGRCYGNQLILGDFCQSQNWPSSLFTLVFWNEMHYRLVGLDARINSSTSCSRSCKNNEHWFNSFWVSGVEMKIVLRLGRNWTIFVHLTYWRSKTDWNSLSQFWFQQVNWQSFLYILWKFGEIQNSDPRVLGESICTAGVSGVDNCYHALVHLCSLWDGAVRHSDNQ